MIPSEMWQAVAEKIEPKPEDNPTKNEAVYSPHQIWIYRRIDFTSNFEWQRRPCDAEKCLMLLKRLPWPEITRFQDLMNKGWMVTPNWDRPAENCVAVELEEAILAAAYKSICETIKS